ncbi:MAG: PDDEXK nuclease domain-containing protein [Defluviitaleaceae bacterium]|nr:PDDEXK nuclease domain-containing protein [Defluviitaleaceae bacterium]
MELANNYFKQISEIITKARNRAEIAINSELVLLYWNIGRVIKTEILEGNKPEYGKSIIENLSRELVAEYGRGYSKSNLFNMVKLYEVFDNEQIFHSASGKLTWTHLKKIMYIDDPLKREFYATLAINERWSVRELEGRIGTMLYERTNLSKKPEITIANDLQKLRNEKAMSTDLVLRDPYTLDFLDLKDNFNEKDLESAIIAELERFILEMGRDFAFVGRQVRIIINAHDFYIDLLFYHRKMRRLVVIELKLEEFKPEHKGQVELYINWLAKHDMNEGDNPPIGIILCPKKNDAIVELLNLEKSDIHIATFLTDTLQKKLPLAIKNAKTLLEQRKQYKEDIDNEQI